MADIRLPVRTQFLAIDQGCLVWANQSIEAIDWNNQQIRNLLSDKAISTSGEPDVSTYGELNDRSRTFTLRWRTRERSWLPGFDTQYFPMRKAADYRVSSYRYERQGESYYQFRVDQAQLPLWLPLVGGLVFPAFALARLFKRKRRRLFCPACGGKIPANADVCPNCARPLG